MCLSVISKFIRYSSVEVVYKKHKFKAFVADSLLKQAIGLMYRKSIGSNEGMLFLFGRPSYYGIWMHNMHFSIDIIWLDEGKRIVDIVENAAPCRSIIGCKVYKPKKPSTTVFEVASGIVRKLDIKIGDKLQFNA